MAGTTLRDVFLRDRDPFYGVPALPTDEPIADPDDPEGHDCPEDDECPVCQGLEDEPRESCGKTARRGACRRCPDCADYGDMKYHEEVDRKIERMSEEDFQRGGRS